MPHFPKPFFKKSHRSWYVEIDRKQINLGPDSDQAHERYHELMRSEPKHADCSLAVGVIDAFLEWVKHNKSPRTYEWYQRHCQAFANSIPRHLSVGKLKPHHVTAFLNGHPAWSSTTKNGLCRAVQRAFRWAEKEELILRSPLAHLEKPRSKRREVVITTQEFAEILASFRNPALHDLLETAWETAARPQELTTVEARHVDLQRARWVFPAEESKGKEHPRVVYLNERALEITRRRMLRHPTGPLFRNADNEPWNRFALNCAFCRLQAALGLKRMREQGIRLEALPRFNKAAFGDQPAELAVARKTQRKKLTERRKALYKLARKHGKKYCLYHFRHSWATRALQRGVDPLTVAILMGHADPSMLAKVYQHLAHDPDFLRQAAMKVSRSA